MQSHVVDLDVETRSDRSLHVRWRLAGPDTDVDVAVGPTPEAVDHRHHTTVPAGTTEFVLPPAGPGRHFVSVAPSGGGAALVAADRRLPFETLTNFRDLGGYRTRHGGRVRWGLVFRAEALHGLTATDLAFYETLSLRTVFDLRGDDERAELPDAVPSRAFPLVGRRSGVVRDPEPADPGLTAGDGERLLYEIYAGILEGAAGSIGTLFTDLLADDGLPAVFHCHGGKDRTGMVAALLLEALGVDREVVLADYELTARYRLRSQQASSYQRMIDRGMPPEAAAAVLGAPRAAMARALDDLDRDHGGIDAYLTGPAGLDRSQLDELLRRLVVTP